MTPRKAGNVSLRLDSPASRRLYCPRQGRGHPWTRLFSGLQRLRLQPFELALRLEQVEADRRPAHLCLGSPQAEISGSIQVESALERAETLLDLVAHRTDHPVQHRLPSLQRPVVVALVLDHAHFGQSDRRFRRIVTGRHG